MTLSVDINCDLGEGYPHDAELMKYISSANIACGYHAGDLDTMNRTVELAIENNVAIGAHPSFDDRANFGRTEMEIGFDVVRELITDQVIALREVCQDRGVELRHVKPHGALYNQSARDANLAATIAQAV